MKYANPMPSLQNLVGAASRRDPVKKRMQMERFFPPITRESIFKSLISLSPVGRSVRSGITVVQNLLQPLEPASINDCESFCTAIAFFRRQLREERGGHRAKTFGKIDNK